VRGYSALGCVGFSFDAACGTSVLFSKETWERAGLEGYFRQIAAATLYDWTSKGLPPPF
jgi:hypothetical protein